MEPRERALSRQLKEPIDVEVLRPGERDESEIVGIKELVDKADLGSDFLPELKLLEGPLEGNFHSFAFHEDVDFYVAQNDQKQYNLAESYFYDREARVYARPRCADDVPNAFRNYQTLNWDTWISGDTVYGIEEKIQLHKVYFIGQLPLKKNQDYPDVDFEELYCIDGTTRSIKKSVVLDLTDDYTVDPVLCIKEGDIAIQDSRDCPTMEGYAHVTDLIEYIDTQVAAKEELLEFDQDLLDETSGSEETIDVVPDVPDADNL